MVDGEAVRTEVCERRGELVALVQELV